MTDPAPAADPPDAAILRRRMLGTGLRADPISRADIARDVSLRATQGGVDLDVVEGLANLGQDLSIGLTTLRGSDVFNQAFGFLGLAAIAQQTSPVLAREGIRSAVVEFLVTDPRVRRIVDLHVDGFEPGRRTLAVEVRFETITGQVFTTGDVGLAGGAPWGAISTPGAPAVANGGS